MRMQTGRTRGRPNNNSTVLLLVPPCRTRSRDLINIPPWAPFTPVLIRSRNLWRTHIRDARPICAPSAAAATAAVRARMLLPSRMYTCSFIPDSFGRSGCTSPIRRFGFRPNHILKPTNCFKTQLVEQKIFLVINKIDLKYLQLYDLRTAALKLKATFFKEIEDNRLHHQLKTAKTSQ